MTSVFPGAQPIDTAGQHGSDGLPTLVANLSIDYQLGDVGVGLSQQYISSGTVSNRYGPTDIDDNHVPHTTYTDLILRYRPAALWDGRVRFSAMVSNLFDEDPEYVPTFSNIAARPTNRDIYDMVGRMYQIGVGIDFR
jgi:hypothetical protein